MAASEHSEPVRAPRNRKALFSRVGWALAVLTSLFLLLLPADFHFPTQNPTTAFLLLLMMVCGIWLVLCLATALIILGHLTFFKQRRGFLAITGLMALCFAVSGLLSDQAGQLSLLIGQLSLLIIIWLLVLPLALGISLSIYLRYHDESITLAAVALPLFVWSLVIYVRRVGSEDIMLEVMTANGLSSQWWFQTQLCLIFWVLAAGIISFLIYSAVLLYGELRGNV